VVDRAPVSALRAWLLQSRSIKSAESRTQKPRINNSLGKGLVSGFLWFGTIWALRRAVSNSGERKRKEARHTQGCRGEKSLAHNAPRSTGGLKSIKGLFSLSWVSIPVRLRQSEVWRLPKESVEEKGEWWKKREWEKKKKKKEKRKKKQL
jgi:hypothetical protein